MGSGLNVRGPEFDGRRSALIPGLVDHHIHLLATATRGASLSLAGCADEAALIVALRHHAYPLGAGQWLRAMDYDEKTAGLPDRDDLDRWLPDRPARVADRTGALWILNSLAIAQLGDGPFPDCVERDSAGRPTGRIWRGDAWLRARIGSVAPSLADLGRQLARFGITAVTDAGAQNGPEEAALLAGARRTGELPQKLMLLGRADLPAGEHYARGALKLLIDERNLPDSSDLARRIIAAHGEGRAVACHCVTTGELLVYLDALDRAGGGRPGDRIEHGGMIPQTLIADVVRHRLTVVTQPAFIHDRGDRYLEHVSADEQPDLYRAASLTAAGVELAAGSDAPYGAVNPWAAIGTAVQRRTRSGAVVGTQEAISPRAALDLYLGSLEQPAAPRRLTIGSVADLCLLDCPLDEALANPDAAHVRATFINGRIVYCAD